MLEINTPAGAPPRDLLDEALRELHGQVSIVASAGEQPPQLQPAITAAKIAQEMNDERDLIKALRDVAHAALASIVRVRATFDHVPSP